MPRRLHERVRKGVFNGMHHRMLVVVLDADRVRMPRLHGKLRQGVREHVHVVHGFVHRRMLGELQREMQGMLERGVQELLRIE